MQLHLYKCLLSADRCMRLGQVISHTPKSRWPLCFRSTRRAVHLWTRFLLQDPGCQDAHRSARRPRLSAAHGATAVLWAAAARGTRSLPPQKLLGRPVLGAADSLGGEAAAAAAAPAAEQGP